MPMPWIVDRVAAEGMPRNQVIPLSVVIPLAPKEQAWRGLLLQLLDCGEGSEILLVHAESDHLDFGDHDPHPNLRLIASVPGRARQLNAGAQAAQGRWLWFLHADSRLTAGVLPQLQRFIVADDDALGYFDLRFERDGPWLTRLNAVGANLRARWLGLPFGDQGFVLRAETFRRLGGYDESAGRGEDHLLVWRARAAGLPLRRLPAAIVTSARRFREHGWWSTTLNHLRLTARQVRVGRRRHDA